MPELDRAKEADLKPCPFCGGPATRNWEGRENNRRHWVYCYKCCAKTNGYLAHDAASAADIWNARYSTSLAAEAAELRERISNPLYADVASALSSKDDEILSLREQLRECREALKPFASVEGAWYDDKKRAIAVLAKLKGGE